MLGRCARFAAHGAWVATAVPAVARDVHQRSMGTAPTDNGQPRVRLPPPIPEGHGPLLAAVLGLETRTLRKAGRGGRWGGANPAVLLHVPVPVSLPAPLPAPRGEIPSLTLQSQRIQVLACSVGDEKGASGPSSEELAECTCAFQLPPPSLPPTPPCRAIGAHPSQTARWWCPRWAPWWRRRRLGGSWGFAPGWP